MGKTSLCLSQFCLQDIRKINSLPRRDGWVKQPRETPADPEVNVGLR